MFRNYLWGGKETHRVGTHEFVDLCRQVKADPMYCVNFLADGRLYFGKMKEGDRLGDARRRPPTGSPTATIPTTPSARRTARPSP